MSNRHSEALNATRSGHFFQLRQSHPGTLISARSGSRIDQPDFLILGKRRCGTTSLYSYLTQHPYITPALHKELHFFDARYDRGLDWYLAQFPPIGNHPELITGEASAGYVDSLAAAERIRRHFPHTRFIILLRDPVERAISHYHMNVRAGLETGALKKTLLDGVDPAADNLQTNAYVDCSIYVKMLQVWLDMFPREQFLILQSEQLFAAPGRLTSGVYEFLGQAPFTSNDYRVENKGTYQSTNVALQQRLHEYFLPHNLALEEILGMRFGWND